MALELTKYIKYCLAYVRLTTQKAFTLQQRYSIQFPKDKFNLLGLLNGDIDGNLGELIKLDIFYNYDPKKVPSELKSLYESEKELANKIEDIYNKFKNDPYTKQIILNFGYFTLEVPPEDDDVILSDEDSDLNSSKQQCTPSSKTVQFPLFTIPVKIEKNIEKGVGKYLVYSVDPEFHVNISVFEKILGDDLYFQLIEKFGFMEVEGQFVLPVTSLDIFVKIWQEIKAQLKLRNANFDENSFSVDETNLSLAPKVNYFLAEDLEKLAKLEQSQLAKTSLTSWIDNADINIYDSEAKEADIYFPFQYDKYKLKVLSVINNKASVVQGPPGTGKSETIANLLCHLAAKGFKVLFVSQKAQALKVVKDKLKKLNVHYLSGYIPNLNSVQLNEEDEVDGIAIQLSALDGYIEKLTYSLDNGRLEKNHSLESIESEKTTLKESFNRCFIEERRFFELKTNQQAFKPFDLGNFDSGKFENNFSFEVIRDIQKMVTEIQSLKSQIKQSESLEFINYFDDQFQKIIGKKGRYLESVGRFKNDYQKTGYDRHNILFRILNNSLRKIRINNDWGQLPREITDYINVELNKDISRSEGVAVISKLEKYLEYYKAKETQQTKENELNELLNKSGITFDQFELIVKWIKSNSFETVKQNIIKFQQTNKSVQSFSNLIDQNNVQNGLNKISITRTQTVANYLQNIINQKFIGRWKKDANLRQTTKKLGKAFGKSKRAFKTFDNLRADPTNFKSILDLIPVWIMELDDASRIIPLENNIFDYVILDEASQCNIAYTLPVMFRASKTLFFGDSEQMRDSTVLFKSNQAFDELARRYQVPEELRIKTTGSSVQSVLDIASMRGFLSIPLRYHYRSPRELIGFSNKYFYKPKGKELIPLNNNYLTYKDTNRVMVVHEVKVDHSIEISDKINASEARAILKLFKELKADARYKDKSIGILSFFNAQASYLRDVFEREGFKEDDNNYKISIIEGIQGDEKDIVIYSFVMRSPDQIRQYYPLTGEGGDIRGDINRGRVNVAFSRARQQVHCFVSMSIADIPDKIWIKKYLEYARDCGKVDSCSVDLRPFDSYFEEEFHSLLRTKLNSDYLIQNQVPSCGFKIDFVVTNLKTERRIAIECDGPTHFKNESDEEFGYYIESDEERQRVLESAGWEFYRIKYSDWINNNKARQDSLKEIMVLLK